MIKNITLALVLSLLFLGCSKDDENLQNVAAKLVVGNSIENIKLNDQFEKSHQLSPDTYRVIFAFSKESAHTCNDFFNTKDSDYLEKHNAQFIADVSAAPSLIRSMFILPGLKDFKHTVLLLETKEQAAPFRKGVNTEAIVVANIINKQIVDIQTLNTAEELQKLLDAPMINKVLH